MSKSTKNTKQNNPEPEAKIIGPDGTEIPVRISGLNSGDNLKNIVYRVENLEDEKYDINRSIADVFSEAKSAGYNVKALKQVIKLRKMSPSEREEQEEMIAIYREEVGMDVILPLFDNEENEGSGESK